MGPSIGKYGKLAPRFSEPFTILEHIYSSSYFLALLDGVEIYLVFHVSRLKELLGSSDNTVTTETLVTSKDLAF